MTEAYSDDEQDTPRFALERKHWLALVAVFAVIELTVVISLIN